MRGAWAWVIAWAVVLAKPAAMPAQAAEDLRLIVQADPNAEQAYVNQSISADGRYVLTSGLDNGTITIWDVARNAIVQTFQLPASYHARMAEARYAALGPPLFSADMACVLVNLTYIARGTTAKVRDRFVYALADQTWQEVDPDAPPARCAAPARGPSRFSVAMPRLSIAGGHSDYTPHPAIVISDSARHTRQHLSHDVDDKLDAAAVSPDGRVLAAMSRGDGGATIRRLDLATSRYLDPVVVPRQFANNRPLLRWIDSTHLLLGWLPFAGIPALSAVHVLDFSGGGLRDVALPARCGAVPLPDGSILATQLGQCVRGGEHTGPALWRYASGTDWQALAIPGLAGVAVSKIAVAPGGQAVLLVTTPPCCSEQPTISTLRMVDLAHRRVIGVTTVADLDAATLLPLADGRLLYASQDKRGRLATFAWNAATGMRASLDAAAYRAEAVRAFNAGDLSLEEALQKVPSGNSATDPALPPLGVGGNVLASGLAANGTLFWAASNNDGVHVWRKADWRPLLTVYPRSHQHYFALAPSGRYDTNLGPDSTSFRWVVRDAPLQSLGAQTFMRDYFTPRLIAEALSGAEAEDPIAPALSLNRVLPQVAITAIARGRISLRLREGTDPRAANGKTRSGLFNLRLFRNNALVAQWPAGAAADDTDLAGWRRHNALKPGRDGSVRVRFLAHLPTGPDAATTTFSAYAFNTDRVKSDTVARAYTRPALPPHPRQAYVLTIGINAYAQPRLRLNYAVNDARLLAERLKTIPGYNVHPLVLAGEDKARPVTRAVIAAALDLLAGGERARDLARLAAAGVDGRAFARATPDDLVVVTFSGHGWADRRGNFHMVPADAVWPDAAASPRRDTLIATADLTRWLRGIDAGAMALVIDACHSAASVETGGFKPGPMGDPGLGQLAYDKGIRILAATQANDVAIEDADLHQGLLTYTLAGEGLDATGFGKADLDGDGRIMLDEWLRYALRRLPALSSDARLRHFGHGLAARPPFTIIADSQAMAAKPQDPALFDFNAGPSTVALRDHRAQR
jgi:hypothetical protein